MMVAMLRMRKRTRGARSPDIDPYSSETKETNRERPRRMLRYLGNKGQPNFLQWSKKQEAYLCRVASPPGVVERQER